MALCLSVVLAPCRAQEFALPINDLSRMRWERAGVGTVPGVHATALPVAIHGIDVSDIAGLGPDTTTYYYKATKKLFGAHLIELRKEGLNLNADAVFDFGYGRETENDFGSDRDLYVNARGFVVDAEIGEGVFVHTAYTETQQRFAGYIDHYVDSLGAVPGGPRTKPFGDGAYDFGMAEGYVAGSPTPWLDVSAGHGKQFIGAGRRSLLWSEQSFNYPFASYTLRPWKGTVQYRYTLALLQTLNRLPKGDAPESVFERNYATSHYLSWKPLDDWEIGLFSATVWRGFDAERGSLPLPTEALAPLPAFNALRSAKSTRPSTGVIGLNSAWRPLEQLRFYGQLTTGGAKVRLGGKQLGLQVFKLFGRVDLRAEYNAVRKGLYTGSADAPSYTHYNQSLAHPYGSGFEEFLAEATYLYKRGYAQLTLLTAKRPNSPEVEQYTDMALGRIMAAYILNPYSNLELYAGYALRSETRDAKSTSNGYYCLGFRTYLRNLPLEF